MTRTNVLNTNMRILVVEDSEVDMEVLKRMLVTSRLSVSLDVARDGREALELLLRREGARPRAEGNLPKLILLDLRLPDMDGIELLRRIKRSPRLYTIPVAMLTGVSGERPMLECMAAGANMYFEKPMTMEDALAALTTVETYWKVIAKFIGGRTRGGEP
ncbi:MAG: response regulator [Dehalococcoidia bacterium]